MARLTIATDGITVEADGPVEALAVIQRDAFEVRLPEPTEEEARRAGPILADILRRYARAS